MRLKNRDRFDYIVDRKKRRKENKKPEQVERFESELADYVRLTRLSYKSGFTGSASISCAANEIDRFMNDWEDAESRQRWYAARTAESKQRKGSPRQPVALKKVS